jgi:hypothetical protein
MDGGRGSARRGAPTGAGASALGRLARRFGRRRPDDDAPARTGQSRPTDAVDPPREPAPTDAVAPPREPAPTFVLTRIVGNDLPPRHRAGQTLDNLRYLLDHEPSLPGCERRWVVNRIVDPEAEAAIVALLAEREERYLVRPLRRDGSDLPPWRWQGLPNRPTYALPVVRERGRDRRLRRLYEPRVRALIDLNGARNDALADGRRDATWVLPWDGGCLITREAWEAVTAAVAAHPQARYVAVPTARIDDPARLWDRSAAPPADQEHMLAFHRDAVEVFDPDRTYGDRDKVALLYRLGVPGPWDGWTWDEHPERHASSPDAGRFVVAGWVARLPAGDEGDLDAAARWRARAEGVLSLVDRYDVLVARRHLDPTAPLLVSVERLDEARRGAAAGDHELRALVRTTAEAVGGDRPDRDDATRLFLRALVWRLSGDDEHLVAARGVLDEAGDDATALLGPIGEVGPEPLPRVVLVADALRLLASAAPDAAGDGRGRASRYDEAAGAGVRRWCRARAAWLDDGRDARRALVSHLGTMHDLERAGVALLLDDVQGALVALRTTQERLAQQLTKAGEPAAHGEDDRAWPETMLQFEAWLAVAQVGAALGLDLWRADVAGRSLEQAAAWLARHPVPASIAALDATEVAGLHARWAALQALTAGPAAQHHGAGTAAQQRGVGTAARVIDAHAAFGGLVAGGLRPAWWLAPATLTHG